jgi:uncharacterized protein YxjI
MSDRSEDVGARSRRFRLHQRLGAVGPDPWIEDDEGERCFEVDETALVRLEAFILRDLHGREVAKLQHSDLREGDATEIKREGISVATVRRTHAALRHHFAIDVRDGDGLEIHGHIGRHEYEIRRGEDVVATVSRKWFRGEESYGVEVAADEDQAMILAATVAIEQMDHG